MIGRFGDKGEEQEEGGGRGREGVESVDVIHTLVDIRIINLKARPVNSGNGREKKTIVACSICISNVHQSCSHRAVCSKF